MVVNNINVTGFLSAMYGMRNPHNSWGKMDSNILSYDDWIMEDNNINSNQERFVLGKNDEVLSQKLTRAGGEHSKHLRFINVTMDVLAPRYWWQEFDQYHFTETLSTSTMHKITSRELTTLDFTEEVTRGTIEYLNAMIQKYRSETKHEERDRIFRVIKSNLPEGFRQMRTVSTNYQQLLSMYQQRKNHKLPEWKSFCCVIEDLPYFVELTGIKLHEDI